MNIDDYRRMSPDNERLVAGLDLFADSLFHGKTPPKEIPMNEMAEAHARDYALKEKCREIDHAITELLSHPQMGGRFSATERHALEAARSAVHAKAKHVVAVWG